MTSSPSVRLPRPANAFQTLDARRLIGHSVFYAAMELVCQSNWFLIFLHPSKAGINHGDFIF